MESVLNEAESASFSVALLVIDKQSIDGSIDLVKRYHDVTLVQQNGNGLASARNEAISLLKAPIIGFCDADDAWTPGSLTLRLQTLLKNPGAWGVAGKVRFVDKTDFTHGLPPRRRVETEHLGFTPGAMLIRREVFAQVGIFDEDLQVGCDSDWIVRATQILGPLIQLDYVVLHKGVRFGSLSTDSVLYRQEMMLIARRFVTRAKNSGKT